MLAHRPVGRSEAAHDVDAGQSLRLRRSAQLCKRCYHRSRSSKDLTHFSNDELTARLALDFAPEKEIVGPGPQALSPPPLPIHR